MDGEIVETCMFFVDDSNIWIEAQKFAASGESHLPKLTDCDSDPRCRIDMGQLLRKLRKGRAQGPSFLYGSRPPPNDSVWKAFEDFKFQTKIFDRAHGKEKQVDNAMATDLTDKATELHIRAGYDPQFEAQKEHTTFVAITGDRDLLPPIKHVLKCNIHVELWAWGNGVSREYLKLDSQNSLLSVTFLNTIFHEISFTNCLSTRRSKGIEPAKTVVLLDFTDVAGKGLESRASGQLIQLGHLFYLTRSKTEPADIFAEFPKVKNVDDMILDLRTRFEGICSVLSWPEYASRFVNAPPCIVKVSNVYEPLAVDSQRYASRTPPANPTNTSAGPGAKTYRAVAPERGSWANVATQDLNKRGNAKPNNTDPDNTEDWEVVIRSNPGKSHRRATRKTQYCPDRLRCKARGECGYRHSNEENDLFRDNPKRDFRWWKTRRCEVADCCHGKRCAFAHAEAEAWCLRCQLEGHYTKECRYTMC